MHLPTLLSRLNIEQSLGAAKNSIKRSCLSLCSSSPSITSFFGMQTAKPITPPPTPAVPAYLPHWLSACWLNTGGKWNCCESCRTGQGTANVELVFYQTNWKICITSYMGYVYIQIEVSTVHSLAMDAVPAGTKPHLFFRESSVVCSSSPLPFLEEPPGYAPSFHFRREMWVNAFLWG